MEPPIDCSRRRFCRRLLGCLGMLVCGGYRPAAATSPYGRPLDRYTQAALPAALQTGPNPHLVAAHRQLQRFGLTAGQRSAPGVAFTTKATAVRAAAPGIVHFIGQRPLPGSQTGAYYIRIAHDLYDGLKRPFYQRATLYRDQAYRSAIYGLQSVTVEHWQSVRRGQVVGKALPAGDSKEPAIKLVLEERGNPVNPDDYGPGHSHMHYAAGDRVPEWDLEQMHRRLDRQAAIVKRLNDFYSERLKDDIHKKIHGIIDTEKFTDVPVTWSTVEKLRYLQHRFRKSPQRFPGLSSATLDSLIRRFLENQPIVLSLPLSP